MILKFKFYFQNGYKKEFFFVLIFFFQHNVLFNTCMQYNNDECMQSMLYLYALIQVYLCTRELY